MTRSVSLWISAMIAGALCVAAVTAPGCSTLEGTQCAAGLVCPPDRLCCGQQCVAASCLNDTVDTGEECQTFGRRACTEDRFDFGHVACTSSCTFDRSPCTRFGFTPSPEPACGPAGATRLSVEGSSVWSYRPSAPRVGVANGSECRTFDLPSAVTHVVATSSGTAVTSLAATASARPAIYALTRDGMIQATYEGSGGALGPSQRVTSASAIDPAVAQLGRAFSLLTTVTQNGSTWRARTRSVHCVAGESAEVRAAVPRGGDLLISLLTATTSRLGLVTRTAAGDELARSCTDLPMRLAVTSAVRVGTRDFLVGNVAPTGAPAYVAVVEVGQVTGATIATTERLGATGALGVAPLSTTVSAWAGPDDALYVLGRRADGSLALMALRGTRWRELDRGADGRRLSDGASVQGEMIAQGDLGVMRGTGSGYELAYDNTVRTDECVDCQVHSIVRAGNTEWLLSKDNLWRPLQNGAIAFRQLLNDPPVTTPPTARQPYTWEPHRGAASPDGSVMWFAAWAQSTRQRLFLLRGVSDRLPSEAEAPTAEPVLVDPCGTAGRQAEAIAMAATNQRVFVAVRMGAGTPECPISYRVIARAQDTREVVAIWQGTEPITALVTPKDGSEIALALVERGDHAEIWSFAPQAGAQPKVVLSSAPANRVRALWAQSATAGWVAGEEGFLLRFAEGVGTAQTTDRPLEWMALDGTSAEDLVVAATGGDLLHFDGDTWAPITPPTQDAALSALHVTEDEIYLGLGLRTLVLRVPRRAAKGATCDLPR